MRASHAEGAKGTVFPRLSPFHFMSLLLIADRRSSTAMEDAHATVLNLEEDKADDVNTFFAVYDGHGGKLS